MSPMWRMISGLLLLSSLCLAPAKADSLVQLASDFWTWRAAYRPFTFDDVPRIEHAPGVRDWSGAAIARQRAELTEFERRWKALRTLGWPVAQMVDYRLMGSAIARVRWELDVNPRWQRDPAFYVEQTVGALQEELLPPPPFSDQRARDIVARAENIPSILEQARQNLKAVAPFAQLTIASLSGIDARLMRVERGVSALLPSGAQGARFRTAITAASKALVGYREWLKQNLPNMRQDFALGDKTYGFFLHQVALLPYTPEQLLAMARQDFERVLAMESYEHQRDLHAPQLKMPATAEEEAARMVRDEAAIRRYLTEHHILTVPPICRIGLCVRLRNISQPWMGLASSTTLLDCRACIRMALAGSNYPRTILPTSGKRMRKIRALRACTKACRGIFSNCRWLGEIPIRSGVNTTIRARTKASASTPKK